VQIGLMFGKIMRPNGACDMHRQVSYGVGVGVLGGWALHASIIRQSIVMASPVDCMARCRHLGCARRGRRAGPCNVTAAAVVGLPVPAAVWVQIAWTCKP
jgi:hypothetical protein